jgi:hypothetical protein
MSIRLSDYVPALKWGAVIDGSVDGHLALETISDTKSVRLNSRNFVATSGDMIGFSTHPAATVAGTGTVYGGQISPRVTAVNAASLVGLGVYPILKSTAATISGDLKGIAIDLDDDAAWTVSGNAIGLEITQQLTSTVSGKAQAIRIEGGGATKQWDSCIDFPGAMVSGTIGGGAAKYVICSVDGVLMKLDAHLVA